MPIILNVVVLFTVDFSTPQPPAVYPILPYVFHFFNNGNPPKYIIRFRQVGLKPDGTNSLKRVIIFNCRIGFINAILYKLKSCLNNGTGKDKQ